MSVIYVTSHRLIKLIIQFIWTPKNIQKNSDFSQNIAKF